MAKASAGVNCAAPTPTPLTASDLPATQVPQGALAERLVALHSVTGVNALQPNQRLDFAPQGVTIILGPNGSGKSGYARILKRAFRARAAQAPLLPNVRTAGIPSSPSATLKFAANGIERDVTWNPNDSAPSGVGGYAVFDRYCAHGYLAEAGQLAPAPRAARYLQFLAETCRKVRTVLIKDRDSIPLPIIDDLIPTAAEAGQPDLFELADPDQQTIRTRLEMTAHEHSELAGLNTLLATQQDPGCGQQASALRAQADRLARAKQACANALQLLAPESIKALASARHAVSASSDVVQLAAAALSFEPLPVGAELWRLLFEAARKYSEALAYPGSAFPNTTEGARCVLCQQELAPDASRRLTRFAEYVASEASQQHEAAKAGLAQLEGRYNAVASEMASATPGDLVADIRDSNATAASALESFAVWAAQSVERVLQSLEPEPFGGQDPAASLAQSETQLRAHAAALTAPPDPSRIQQQRRLRAKEALAAGNQRVLDYFRAVKLRALLDKAARAADTTPITTKASEWSKAADNEVSHQVKDWCNQLGMQSLPFAVEGHGEIGQRKHQLELDNRAAITARLTDVLSEGEATALALGAFLAETSLDPPSCGIILDDPVSSFDNVRRKYLAEALARVSQDRNLQVIAFTHDPVFAYELHNAAETSGIASKTIEIFGDSFQCGTCSTAPPLNVGPRLQALLEDAKRWRLTALPPGPARDDIVRSAYGKLRAAWERLIADELLNRVVERHGDRVQPVKLEAVTVTDEDVSQIAAAYDKCSRFMPGHDAPLANPMPAPTADNLIADINAAIGFYSRLRQRRTETLARRSLPRTSPI
ncbi:MAG: AAA family ATPase [Terriglobales bacterium]